MAKPTDTRCRAKDEESGDGRCEGDITLDENGTWLIWCADHASLERMAKTDGGPRVEKVSIGVGDA